MKEKFVPKERKSDSVIRLETADDVAKDVIEDVQAKKEILKRIESGELVAEEKYDKSEKLVGVLVKNPKTGETFAWQPAEEEGATEEELDMFLDRDFTKEN